MLADVFSYFMHIIFLGVAYNANKFFAYEE
jgi:hypothetical protein